MARCNHRPVDLVHVLLGVTLTLMVVLHVVVAARKRSSWSDGCTESSPTHGDSCYVISSSSGKWSDGYEKCDDLKGTLITIQNETEGDIAERLASNEGRDAWIGHYRQKDSTEWKYVGGKTIGTFGKDEGYWPDDWESTSITNTRYAYVKQDGTWRTTTNKRDQKRYICELRLSDGDSSTTLGTTVTQATTTKSTGSTSTATPPTSPSTSTISAAFTTTSTTTPATRTTTIKDADTTTTTIGTTPRTLSTTSAPPTTTTTTVTLPGKLVYLYTKQLYG